MKGQLYLPTHYADQPIPTWINTKRRLGLWGQHIPAAQDAFYRLQRHEWIYPQAQPSSLTATWWTDGLYKKIDRNDFYMYRQPVLTQYPSHNPLSSITFIHRSTMKTTYFLVRIFSTLSSTS